MTSSVQPVAASPSRRRRVHLLALAGLVVGLAGCGPPGRELRIYTSLYKEVYPLFEPGLERAFPGVTFRWYQSGSEKLAAKVLAELEGGGARADLLMTSDLFFYQELAAAGHLLALDSPAVAALPAALRDPGGAFVVNRLPLMVLAYNPQRVVAEDVPTRFEDLLDPRYQGRLTMPSPLESGSALTTVLYLDHAFGESYFAGLRANDVLAAGGNGATLARIQSGERPVGMVLLENVLQAKARGSTSVEVSMPRGGALAVPAPLAAFRDSADPDLARRVLDWLLGEAARRVIVQGWVHTAFAEDPPPPGAPPWADIEVRPWDLATFAEWGARRQDVKSLFHRVVLR